MLGSTCRFLIVFAVWAAGCNKEDPPTPKTDDSRESLADRFGVVPGIDPDTEDPEVAAHFAERGWNFHSEGTAGGYLVANESWTALSFGRNKLELTPEDWKMLGKSKVVQELDLRKVRLDDEAMGLLAKIENLASVTIDSNEVTDVGVKALAAARKLVHIRLDAPKVTDAGLRELGALPKLRVLLLVDVKIDGSGFEAFAGSKSLNHLELTIVPEFSDVGARHVAKLTGLSKLNLSSVGGFGEFQGGRNLREGRLTREGIRTLVAAKIPDFKFELRHLDDALLATLVAESRYPGSFSKWYGNAEEVPAIDLGDSAITDKGLDLLLGCVNIESFEMTATPVTDAGIAKLNAFKRLDRLSLKGMKLAGAGLAKLADLPLKRIELRYCDLTEETFRSLGKIAALEDLHLYGSRFQGEWLKHLAGLRNLANLEVNTKSFDDAAARSIGGLPALRVFYLHGSGVTDAGLPHLLKSLNLERLILNNSQISREAYLKTKREHPNVKIEFDKFD